MRVSAPDFALSPHKGTPYSPIELGVGGADLAPTPKYYRLPEISHRRKIYENQGNRIKNQGLFLCKSRFDYLWIQTILTGIRRIF
jgi:hypothetical protein